MNKQNRDGNITWSWEGDTFALRGFNVAITPYGGNPNSESIAKARVEASSRSYTFENITIDADEEYQGWVQAIYEGGDSAWQTTGKITVPDDGTPTIVSSTDGDTIADETEQNAKEYFDSRYIKDNDELIHFDEHLTSTNGMAPDNDYTVTLRDDGKFKGGVAVEEATENILSGKLIQKTKTKNGYEGWLKIWDSSVYFYQDIVLNNEDIPVLPNTTYTFQCIYWEKGDGVLSPDVYLRFDGTGYPEGNVYLRAFYHTSFVENVKTIDLGNGFYKRISTFRTTDDTSNITRFFARVREGTPEIFMADIQLEKKQIPTSFIESTRDKGKLNYPINTDNKTINFYRKGVTSLVENTGDDFSKGILTDVDVVGDGVELANDYALSFDGVDDYVEISNDNIVIDGSATIQFSIYPTSVSGNNGVFGNYRLGGEEYGNLVLVRNGNFRVDGRNGSGNYYSVSTPVNANQQYNITFVSNGSDWILYDEEGTELSRTTGAGKLDWGNLGTSAFDLGYDSGTGSYFEGDYYSFRLFKDRVLTPTEISNSWDSLSNNETGLIAYHKFDEGTGTTLTDYAGTNDGTINGATWINHYGGLDNDGQGTRQSPQLILSDINNVTGSLIEWKGNYIEEDNFGDSMGGSYHGNAGLIYFDVHRKMRLDSVLIDANFTGDVVITLQDGSGGYIKDKTINISTSGEQRIDIGWVLEPGSYRIGRVTNTTATPLRRIQGAATFPYESKYNIATMTGTNAADYYYYFFDWHITDLSSLKVETSVDNGSSWQLCENGGSVPNLPTSPTTLDVRLKLSTGATTITPTLSEVKAYIFTDSDDEYRMYTIKPDGTAYLNGTKINAVPNAVIDITEPGKLQFKPNNIYDELLIKDGDVKEEDINNWYELGRPFEDNDQKFNTSTPTNVTLTEVND